MMKIALQLYSIHDAMEQDFEGTLRKVKEMGYEGVEFAGLFGHEPAEVKSLIEKYALVPVSAHVSIEELAETPARRVGDYKLIGCRYIAVPWLNEDKRYGTPAYRQVKSDLVAVAEECERQGITLLYHNHAFEFAKVNGEYVLDLLYKEIPLLQSEIDTCWVNASGEDPAMFVRKYAGRAPVVHLKDFVYRDDVKDDPNLTIYEKVEYRPLGTGLQDVPALVKAAADAGASWVVVEQDKPSMGNSPLECAQMSIDFLRGNRTD